MIIVHALLIRVVCGHTEASCFGQTGVHLDHYGMCLFNDSLLVVAGLC